MIQVCSATAEQDQSELTTGPSCTAEGLQCPAAQEKPQFETVNGFPVVQGEEVLFQPSSHPRPFPLPLPAVCKLRDMQLCHPFELYTNMRYK